MLDQTTLAGGLRRAFWLMGEKLLRLGGTFLLMTAIARSLGPEQFAPLALATAITTVLGFLGSLGLESVVLRDMAQRPDAVQAFAGRYLRIRCAGALLVPPLAVAYVWCLHTGDLHLLLATAVLSFSALCISLDVVDLVLQSRHQMLQTSVIRSTAFAIAAIVKILLVLASSSLVWFAVAQLLEFVLTAAMYGVIGWRQRWLQPSAPQAVTVRAWLHAHRYMVMSGLTVALYSKIDMLVIGQLLPKAALGQYAIAVGMSGALNVVGMALSQSVAPRLSRLHVTDPSSYRRAMRSFLLLMLVTSCALAMLASLLAHPLITLLAGSAFTPAADILQVLAWVCVPVFLGIATSQIIVNEHLYGLSLLRTAAGLAFITAIIVPAAQHSGAIGVAWAVVASSCVATGMLLASGAARVQLASLCHQDTLPQ